MRSPSFWDQLGVRGQQFVVSLSLIIGVGAVFGLLAEQRVAAATVARIELELDRQARLASFVLRGSKDPDDVSDAVGQAVAARVTFVDSDGAVRGDSELDGDALLGAGSHGDRPEIRAALQTGQGVSRRHSATLDVDMLYVARRVDGGGVVRVALPLTAVDQAVATVRGFFVVAGLVALLVAVVGAAFASHAVSRRLRSVLQTVSDLRRRSLLRDEVNSSDDDDVEGLARSFGTLTDTLEKHVQSLADERDRFDALLQAMGEGVVALDDSGRVVLANAAARTLLALGQDDVLGRRLAVLSLLTLIDDAARGIAGAAEVEVIDGDKLRRVLVRATPKMAVAGRRGGGVVLVVHDVTEIRRLETLRRDFVANVSHELRTPCSVILANAETLLSGALDDGPRAQKFVEALHRNAEHLARLIADLLELSKIEAGKVTFVRVPLNVHAAAVHVVEAIEPRVREKDLSLVLDVDVGLQIEADPKALDQVLINLIDNAVKYTPAGGHVRVSAQRLGNVARLWVEDDGPGVEGKHKERLFERFYRVDSGRSRDVGGTGLGLAIVKHLVEAMDGDVGVEDVLPHGTRFWIELPLFGALSPA